MNELTDKDHAEENPAPGAERTAITPHDAPATDTPHAESAASTAPAPEPAPRRRPVRRRDLLPALCAIGFVILAVGEIVLWFNPMIPPQVRDADQRIDSLDARLRQIEARPVPPPAASPGDLAKVAARVDALEARQNADPAQVAQRLDVMGGRIEGLTSRLQNTQDSVKQALGTLSDRISKLESAENSTAAIQSHVAKLARVQEASIALSEGKPLGDMPNAPQALTKFAKTAPPTEAQLRLSFPKAERAALAAVQPDQTKLPFVDRVWEKAQGLVTIKRGNDVVIGNQSAVALAAAKSALDAGDLNKAVAALDHLAEAPKKAMADWLDQAKSLLAARSALASMAGQA